MSAATDEESLECVMPPPPPTEPAEKDDNNNVVIIDRKMNDSTMPPPPRVKQQPQQLQQPQPQPGQPRKKVPAVDPRARFGLHDWKRLLQKSKDLAQLRGEPPRRSIPLEEIRRHNKNHDGWIILRGNVYNIGPYLPYHPGGISVFKNILGKDGTSMFDKYHRWVNIEGLIGPLFIGTAAAAPVKNEFSIIPPKESHLTNAPRIQIQQVLKSSSLALGRTDDEEDEDDG